MLRAGVRLIGLLLALELGANGAQAADERPPSPDEAALADATNEVAPEIGLKLGDVWLTPFVAPAYTPELGLLVAAGGMFAGAAIGKRISTEHLKQAFGWFVLLVGVAILIRELTVFINQ